MKQIYTYPYVEESSSHKRPFKKYVTDLGGRGSSKIVTNSDKGEGGQAKQ